MQDAIGILNVSPVPVEATSWNGFGWQPVLGFCGIFQNVSGQDAVAQLRVAPLRLTAQQPWGLGRRSLA